MRSNGNMDGRGAVDYRRRSRSRSPPPREGGMAMKWMRGPPPQNTANGRIYIPPISPQFPLFSFKSFMLKQSDEIDADEARVEYTKYKQDYERNFYEHFINENKKLAYLIERYHPNYVSLQFDKQCLRSKLNAVMFTKMVREEALTALRWSIEVEYPSYFYEGNTSPLKMRKWTHTLPYTLENLDEPNAPFYFQMPLQNCLQIDQIDEFTTKWDLVDTLKELPGFVDVFISDNLDGPRTAWCYFYNSQNKMSSYNHLSINEIKIRDYVISVSLPKVMENFEIGVTPPILSHPQRIDEDVQHSYNLIKKFDEAYNVNTSDDAQSDILSSNYFETIDNPTERLDLQIFYLRKVHNVCYYSCQHFSDELQPWKYPCVYYLRPNIDLDDISISQASSDQTQWVKLLDQKIQNLLSTELIPPPKVSISNPFVQTKWTAYCEEKTQKDAPDKYRCTLCRKCFVAPHNVANHLRKHHSGALEEIIDGVAIKLMKDAYMADTNKPGPTIRVHTEEKMYKPNPKAYSTYQYSSVPEPNMGALRSYMPPQDSGSYLEHPNRNLPLYHQHSFYSYPHHHANSTASYMDRPYGNNYQKPRMPPARKPFRDYDNPEEKPNGNSQAFSRPVMTYDDL